MRVVTELGWVGVLGGGGTDVGSLISRPCLKIAFPISGVGPWWNKGYGGGCGGCW